MPVIIRTPDKKISLTKEEAQYLFKHLETCKVKGFTGINHFDHAKEREELLDYSLTTFAEKLFNKWMNNYHQPATKKLNYTVNFAEEKALIAMFKRVGCDPYIEAVMQKILLTLRPTYSAAKV